MAIVNGLRGLQVQVRVGDRPLQEHAPPPDDNEEDSDTSVTRYVVAEPGKEFYVSVKCAMGFKVADACDVSVSMYIDGKWATSRIMRNDQPDHYFKIDEMEQPAPGGGWVKRSFMFSELKFANDQAPPTSTKQIEEAKKLGEIKICLRRGRMGARSSGSSRTSAFAAVSQVHEKALKGRAISYSAGLGKAQAMPEVKFAKFLPYDEKAFAEYTFRYRSRADLQAEMIIPRSPTPVLLEDRTRESLSREELMALLAHVEADNRKIKAEGIARIKRERTSQRQSDSDSDSDHIEVVQPLPKRQRVIETVDLTGD